MMDFEWVAIGLDDVTWIGLAFVLGFAARSLGLPPLVGFLATGFLLGGEGVQSNELFDKLADLGITLLLFTVGLKLNLRTLARPQVWAVTGIHTLLVVASAFVLLFFAGMAGLSLIADLQWTQMLLVAFALSFSSTVFVVKILEERGGMTSLHGRVAVGILLMQDVFAVVFLAMAAGVVPSAWALLLLLLIPLRRFLCYVMERAGHGELLVLYGLLLALGGAEVFDMVGMKADLGALVVGISIASHPKAEEMSKVMLGFKDLFLLGFFVSIGMSGRPDMDTFVAAIALLPLLALKSGFFLLLLTGFRLRARTSFLSTLSLSNYSEFGLIVVALSVSQGWLAESWLLVLSLALSMSLVFAALLNAGSHALYDRFRRTLGRLQRRRLIADDQLLDLKGAEVVVIGMGGVGTGAYDRLREQYGDRVVGIDIDPVTTANQQAEGRHVLRGDPSDPDFWDRLVQMHTVRVALLALPNRSTNLSVLDELKRTPFDGVIAATARFEDEAQALREAGAEIVFNMYAEAGMNYADHLLGEVSPPG